MIDLDSKGEFRWIEKERERERDRERDRETALKDKLTQNQKSA